MFSLREIFLSTYHRFTPNQRNIFKYLQWQSKNRRACFPSLEAMAKFANCSVRTVSRAIIYFREMTYLTWDRRYNQSNVYEMDNDLVGLDLDNPETFRRTDVQPVVQPVVHPDGQLLYIPHIHSNGTCTPKASSVPQIDSSLREIPLPLKDKAKLTSWFKPFQLAQAVEDYFWYISKGRNVKTPFGFLISQAKKAWG